MSVLRKIGRVIAGVVMFVLLTALQFAILGLIALGAYAGADAVLSAGGSQMHENIAIGAAVIAVVVVVVWAEWGLAKTPLKWLRISENPLSQLPHFAW